MAVITKPVDINKIWAASGDVLAPSDTKISQGWGIEIPPRQYFNYIDGKQDQAIAHINQNGIASWDAITEYQYSSTGLKSLCMGSNGTVYRAKQVNTNKNPTTDTTNTYWEVAFAADNKYAIATAAQAQAQTNDAVLITPAKLASAFGGGNTQLSPAAGFQKFPGGLIMQWGTFSYTASGTTTQTTTIPLPIAFSTAILTATVTTPSRLNNTAIGVNIINSTLTTLSLDSINTTGSGPMTVYYTIWGY